MICQYPYKGKFKITTVYGKTGSWACGWHTGTDFVGLDAKNIYPIAEGRVINTVKGDKSYGNYIRISHTDSGGAVYISHYAHLASIKVAVGDKVSFDTVVGVEGATGNAAGTHLHLEIHQGVWKYPSGYTVKTAAWMYDPDEFIKARLEEEDMQTTEMKIGMPDGSNIKVDGYVVNQTSYLPLRQVLEALGYKVGWKNGMITIDK